MTVPSPHRRPTRLLAVVAAAALALGACGGDDDAGSSVATADLEGRTFVVDSVDGAELAANGTLALSFADGRVAALGGCNTASGTFSVDGGKLVVGEMMQTLMGCEEELMAQDTWVVAFLTSSPSIALDGDDLELSNATITIDFDEGPAPS